MEKNKLYFMLEYKRKLEWQIIQDEKDIKQVDLKIALLSDNKSKWKILNELKQLVNESLNRNKKELKKAIQIIKEEKEKLCQGVLFDN